MLPYHNFVESFVGSGILVTRGKVSLQKSGLAGQLLKIKDLYKCLTKVIEKMESVCCKKPHSYTNCNIIDC